MGKQIWRQGPPNKHRHTFFTNRKLPIHSETVPGSRSNVITYTYDEKKRWYNMDQDKTTENVQSVLSDLG